LPKFHPNLTKFAQSELILSKIILLEDAAASPVALTALNQGLLHKKQNQIFHYTRRITTKRVTSWRCPFPRHCAKATKLPA